jgi:hypothetical protein
VNANRQQVNVCAAPRKRFRRLRFEQANKNNRYLMGLKLTTPDPSSRLTVIFTTLNRPEAATRLVKSIRYYYPNMEIIVGDQSEPTSSMSLFYSYYNVLYIHLDGHCSVSEVRTACANAARTDFVVLVEDDFIFSGETDLSIPLLQLDADSSVGFVGGSIFDIHGDIRGYHQALRRRAENYLFYDPKRGTFLTVPIDYLLPRSTIVGGKIFYDCDQTLNWGVMRKSILQQVWWDPQFTSHSECQNFFLDMKVNSSYKVSFCPDLVCFHQGLLSDILEAFRDRQPEWARFGEKWKLRDHLEIGLGLHSYDDYEALCWREHGAEDGPRQLPWSSDSYVRLLPNGQAFCPDAAAPEAETGADVFAGPAALPPKSLTRPSKLPQKSREKQTVGWKLARPFMKTEQYIRRFVRGWKAA